MNKRNLNTLVFFAVILLAGAGVFLSLMESEPPRLKFENLEGVIVESPPTPLPDFQMTTHEGKPFTKKDYLGKWSIVFFGYANCPDVCPTTLTALNQVAQMPNLPDTQFVFHTVDPKRDTVEKLAGFIEFFNEDFIAVTGPKSEIDKFAEPLGVIYDFEGDTSKDDYIVTHFAAVYIIDPKARLRAYVLPPHNEERVGDVYIKVREYYGD